MASSTDLAQLFEKYQSEGVSLSISIVAFCQLNGVVMVVELVDKDGLLYSSAVSNLLAETWSSVATLIYV